MWRGIRCPKRARMQSFSSFIAPDALSDALKDVRFKTAIFCRSELGAPWGFSVGSRDFASFHLVTRGSALLDVDGWGERVSLDEGDLIILPRGDAHVVRDAPGSAATGLDVLIAKSPRDARGRLRSGGTGASTTLLCGGFHI